MLRRALFRITATLPCRLIKLNDKSYLERYYVGRLFGLVWYLHRFVSSDDERAVHDHPWSWSASLILVGGYLEERVRYLVGPGDGWKSDMRRMFPGRLNIIRARDFHRVIKPKPDTWTLFCHRYWSKEWGFLERADDMLIYHQPYESRANKEWWRTAKIGRDTPRESFSR